jgi:predicted secreted Zn-dependent protease
MPKNKHILPILVYLILGWTLAILAPAMSQSSKVKIYVENKYYPVSGETFQAISQSMDKNSPIIDKGKKYRGYTHWHVKAHYYYNSLVNTCHIDPQRISVVTDIQFILPQWQDQAKANAQVTAQWQKYYQALQLHENGHKNHGLQAANLILQRLLTFSAYSSCQELEQAANHAIHEIIDRYAQADVDYDRRTGHGKTQGAVFP